MSNSKPSWIVRWLCLSVAVALTAWLLPGIDIKGGILHILGIALVLALINMFIRPVVTFLALPFVVITLGLFLLVINALTLSWAASLTGWLHIHSFGWAVLGSIVISIFSALLQKPFKPNPYSRHNESAEQQF